MVDTAFFRGNYPPYVSIEAASIDGYPEADQVAAATWHTLVEKSPARGDTENFYPVSDPHRWTHVRLSIYPDGGVARFRVHGEVALDPRLLPTTIDLLALEYGGRFERTSDAFYSSPANLILPDRPRSMGEGWENARRRGPGNDWAMFALGVRGVPRLLEVDTSYFIGNAPGEVRVSVADAESGSISDAASWRDILPRTSVLVDTRHRFPIEPGPAATHLRLDVYPDGGLSRLRCFGDVTDEVREALHRRFLAALPDEHRLLLDPG